MRVDEDEDVGSGLTILVGRLQYPEVSCPGDAPGRVLDIVALPIDGPVLVGEAEGGLDVGTHVGQHRLLDRDPLHFTPNLRGVESKPLIEK